MTVATGEPQLLEFLGCPTPEAWLQAACVRREELLNDHANCEKKAASTALSLLFAYPEDRVLTERVSRLAREELRHFEQVQRVMGKLGVPFARLKPSRYAQGLRRVVRLEEPGRQPDLLLCGAFIEARSCERFMALAPRLDEPLASFYRGLSEAESRHFLLYLQLARRAAAARAQSEVWQAREEELRLLEARLIEEPDPQFRFHSGLPMQRCG